MGDCSGDRTETSNIQHSMGLYSPELVVVVVVVVVRREGVEGGGQNRIWNIE